MSYRCRRKTWLIIIFFFFFPPNWILVFYVSSAVCLLSAELFGTRLIGFEIWMFTNQRKSAFEWFQCFLHNARIIALLCALSGMFAFRLSSFFDGNVFVEIRNDLLSLLSKEIVQMVFLRFGRKTSAKAWLFTKREATYRLRRLVSTGDHCHVWPVT